jgi:enoyl-CoA hydratase/carnithine racemase
MSTAASGTATETLVERMGLKTLVESCLVLEEGVASAKDIEIGMMMGAGILPGPFARADERGLDDLLEALERAQAEWGDAFEPPLVLRRLVAQGRLGKKSGQGFFTFSAGADIKEFTKMKPEQEGRELLESGHRLMRSMEQSPVVTIAAVNSLAFGGGCELAMACDVRLAAESASFGQPEINLGIIPGFGGTQRLPRLVGQAKALEMNLTGDPIDAYDALRLGLANRVVPDHELFDTAMSWARKLAQQAPLGIQGIKQVSAAGDLDEGLRTEAEAFGRAFGSEDAKEGISAFLGKRRPDFKGK